MEPTKCTKCNREIRKVRWSGTPPYGFWIHLSTAESYEAYHFPMTDKEKSLRRYCQNSMATPPEDKPEH